MGNSHTISQIEPVVRDSAALFVPPSKYKECLAAWNLLCLPTPDYDRALPKLFPWHGRIDEEAAMLAEKFKHIEDYRTRFFPNTLHCIVPASMDFDPEYKVDCAFIVFKNRHKMWCHFQSFIDHISLLAPFVDDAVLVMTDDYDIPEHNITMTFRSGVLTCTQNTLLFQVWRKGADGKPLRVGDPTGKPDAEDRVQKLNLLRPHQHWYERVPNN